MMDTEIDGSVGLGFVGSGTDMVSLVIDKHLLLSNRIVFLGEKMHGKIGNWKN